MPIALATSSWSMASISLARRSSKSMSMPRETRSSSAPTHPAPEKRSFAATALTRFRPSMQKARFAPVISYSKRQAKPSSSQGGR